VTGESKRRDGVRVDGLRLAERPGPVIRVTRAACVGDPREAPRGRRPYCWVRKGRLRMRATQAEPSRSAPPAFPWRWMGAAACLTGAIAVGSALWVLVPAWRLVQSVACASLEAPSRLYARPLALRVGAPISPHRLMEELGALAYLEEPQRAVPAPGAFRVGRDEIVVHLWRFPTAGGVDPGGLVEVRFSGGTIAGVRRDGVATGEAALEPVVLATYLSDGRRDRRPLPAGALPEPLVHAVLAAEDDTFFSHAGVSFRAIARAAWVDVREGEAAQGGSTITQQVVKGLLLSGERTFTRKVREAALAVLLELRMSKAEILRAYLDTVYLGVRDGVHLTGVGAAARAYFGKDADELTLAQAATLAGMLPAPSRTSPAAHPDRARARRDRVLRRMAALGWASREDIARALAEPVDASPAPIDRERAPYAAAAAAAEAAERAGAGELARSGLALLSTLEWRDQEAADGAVRTGLARLAERGHAGLQAALVSIDPRDGGVRAYVGGGDWAASQFDRAGSARRQAGSAFKPVVYTAAFASGVAAPATILDDEPLEVASPAGNWQPRDDDGVFLGPLPARTALEESRNVPAARLGLEVGLDEVVGAARAMGISSPLDAVPALSLGACSVTPRELAIVYATLAAGGVRRPVHLLDGALGRDGRPVTLAPLAEPAIAVSPPVAYLVTDVLRGVLDRGTGASARAQGVEDELAGKTGTSNGGRDAWFAGYSPDRATVAWVGRDDDRPTGLTGARAALPIWARFVVAVRPADGYPAFVEPEGLVHARVDPTTGELATSRCPEVVEELFLAGRAPTATCHLHGGWLAVAVEQPEGVSLERPGFFRRLLAKVFGRRPTAP